MNRFKFYPVGQGLFYVGSLADGAYNFVYDCGTKSKKKYIESSVDAYIDELQIAKSNKPSIDFVVISHLHKDHFSGLYRLSQKARIKNVYLPYLGRDINFISLVIANVITPARQTTLGKKNQDLFEYVLGLYMEDRNEFRQIEQYENDRYVESYTEQDMAYFKYDECIGIDNGEYWKFVFLNRRISNKKIDELIGKMNKILGKRSIAELIKQEGGIKEVKDIYCKVFNDVKTDRLNITSTVLIHYPLYERIGGAYVVRDRTLRQLNMFIDSSDYAYMGYTYGVEPLRALSTVLTGDAIIDGLMGREISKHLRVRSDSGSMLCGVLQVPHHGSRKNWEAWEKTGIDSNIYAISYGEGNQHKHPSFKTIDYLVFASKNIQLINQIQDFEYIIP